MVQVLVVDDQPPFRAAARAVLSRIAEFDLVGEAASGEEAVAMSDSSSTRTSCSWTSTWAR